MFKRDRKPIRGHTSESDQQKTPFIQRKLAFGSKGDPYEVEADTMANKVVGNGAEATSVQKKEGEEEIQQKPLAAEVTPLVQKMEATEEEQPVQKMEEEEAVQSKEEEESIQKQEEEEAVQSKEDEEVQMMEEEEAVQSKCADCKKEEQVQKQEEEEAVQSKSENTSSTTNTPSFESRLRGGSGGQKMDAQTQGEMESGFGADFSHVNIHNDSEAAQMSKDIGAQAFTHGNDIYFNEGKYNPNSKGGKHLLAHELTHTIQQKGMVQKKIQPYGGCTSTKDATINADHSLALTWLNGAIANLASYNGTTPSKVKTALSTHFGGVSNVGFAAWIKTNLIYLRVVAWMAGYQCETTGNSSWACTSSSTLATTFWCVPFVDVRLCPGYFSSSQSDRVTTLIHEWVHKYGCNFDLGYEHESHYSGNGTLRQLLNADSFANFVRDAH
ncbi:DUF4157 domain-containing protein [Tenacibaculum tangerinum]|uniref:DUF4157 domain-containing protein n=1 Tax=Tenacibaculum tangerinum TaxID=3038772 RepID=A0ABY8KYR7_9FLAO|nr:DUF4157 domain-containing protein [Tenacibaculum tangerinum]WGH74151.1 DUF4157 domain-containing protein [Tenacibaculum tangerinum]